MQRFYFQEGQDGHRPSSVWKHDANSNLIGRSNKNHILDIHLFEVKVPGSEETELAANIIPESIYALCDSDGNKYLFFEAFIDHR